MAAQLAKWRNRQEAESTPSNSYCSTQSFYSTISECAEKWPLLLSATFYYSFLRFAVQLSPSPSSNHSPTMAPPWFPRREPSRWVFSVQGVPTSATSESGTKTSLSKRWFGWPTATIQSHTTTITTAAATTTPAQTSLS